MSLLFLVLLLSLMPLPAGAQVASAPSPGVASLQQAEVALAAKLATDSLVVPQTLDCEGVVNKLIEI